MKKLLLSIIALSLSSNAFAQQDIVTVDVNGNEVIETDVFIGSPKSRPLRYSNNDLSTLSKVMQSSVQTTSSDSDNDYTPNDLYFDEQLHWLPREEGALGYNNILESVRLLSPVKRPVVGIIDSGFYQHPDLNYVDGYNFARIDSSERGEYFFIPEEYNGSPEDRLANCIVHGSGVAAVAAATRDNEIGFAGISDADLLVSRSMECGFGYLSDSSDSILWQLGEEVDDVRPATVTADVINLSLGGEFDRCPTFFEEAVEKANEAKVPLVVSIGNAQIDASGQTPTNCAGVINVAAATLEGDLFPTSNFGELIDIATFGDSVASVTEDPDSIGWWEESSFAAPTLTGVLANAIADYGKLTNAEIKFFLYATAQPFIAGQCDDSLHCGAGILDAGAFHKALGEYKAGETVLLNHALNNTELCDKELYATDDNELSRLCETYELVLPEHQSNRDDTHYEILAFDKGESMLYENGEVVAETYSSRMLLSTLDMDSYDYGVRMCNSERCFGREALNILNDLSNTPELCKE
jgi:serine protease